MIKIDPDKLLCDVREASGVRVHHVVNQTGISLRYGYAFVDLPYANGARYRAEHEEAAGRREGGAVPFREVEWTAAITTYDDLVRRCAETLKTGRTVECGAGVGIRQISDWPHGSNVDHDMQFLIRDIKGDSPYDGRDAWDLSPDYQRGHVWTERQAVLFVGHVLEGGAVPPIFVQRYDCADHAPDPEYWNLPVEVIDGQQRLRALVGWVEGDFAAELTDGRLIWYRDTNEVDRFCLPMIRITYLDISRADRLRFYLRLNRGGTVHTDDEINRVRDMLDAEGGDL